MNNLPENPVSDDPQKPYDSLFGDEKRRREMEVLKKVSETVVLVIEDDETYEVLKGFEMTGLIKFGFYFGKKQSEVSFTPLGKRYYEAAKGA